jgi:hypothetical protein
MEENGRASSVNSAARATLVNATIDTVASKNVFIVSTCVAERISIGILGHTPFRRASYVRTTRMLSMNHLNEGKDAPSRLRYAAALQ